MYKCPGCGAPLRFDPDSQKVVCDHCGRQMDANDAEISDLNLAKEQGEVSANALNPNGTYNAYVYCCPNCGAKLLSTDQTATTFCSFCGSNVELEERLDQEQAPDVVIPFKISKKACVNAYRRIIRRAFFAPEWMRKDTQIERFRGIYMPYWIYSYRADGPLSVAGKVSHREGDYIVSDNYSVSTMVNGYYGGIAYDASASFSDTISEAVAPFNRTQREKFKKPYLSGFYADVTDVPPQVYGEEAKGHARRFFGNQLMQDPAFYRYGCKQSTVECQLPIQDCAGQKGYFPVWFLANRSKDGKHVSYAVVNGESGKTVADLPVAFWKYILLTLLLAVPIGFLLWQALVNSSAFSLSPGGLMFVQTLVSVIMLFMLNSGVKKAYLREHRFDDLGYLSAKKIAAQNVGNLPGKLKWAVIWKPILTIAASVLMFLWAPIEDYFYYIVAVGGLILLTLSVFDLVRLHNKQAETAPPQFGERGGNR